VILSEYLPHSTDPDILVELVDPPESSLHLLTEVSAESDMIDTVVNDPLLINDKVKAANSHIFYCKKTHQVVWALWIQPKQTLRLRYSYRLLWPEGQEITIY
jgi:hypothetical protein